MKRMSPARKPVKPKPKPPLSPVVKRLIAHRLKLDMSQAEYADMIGMPLSTLRKYEQAVNEPDQTITAFMNLWLKSQNA